ncbi:MAG TPA: hypothetical protein VF933_33330 [Streptosporangiaceae bacterium]
MSASKQRRQLPPRPPYIYNRLVRDGEFVQRVRRHIPASLVLLVARYGAAYADDAKYMNATSALYAPWVLAEVARTSLIYGTDFNRKPETVGRRLRWRPR